VAPQDVYLEAAPDAGRFKVGLVGPGGAKLDGVDVQVFQPRKAGAPGLVAVLQSGQDWRPMAPGKYVLKPQLPAGSLVEVRPVEISIAPGESTETEIRLAKDLIAADVRIEMEGGVVPAGAAVRIRGEGTEAVYRSLKPERIRVWVPPTRLSVEVHVSERARAEVEIDFSVAGPHTITVTER
jgi:hypothetical protein